MSLNILDHLALAYQPIWNARRQLAAVRLRVLGLHPQVLDAGLLLQVLESEHVPGAPALLVSFADRDLLAQALSRNAHEGIWLELPDEGEFTTGQMRQQAAQAKTSGHVLVQAAPLARGQVATGRLPDHLLTLWPEQAAQALAASAAHRPFESPVLAGQIYQHVGSRALADHCLDEARAWGLCGWPVDDTLHSHRNDPLTCDRHTIERVLRAIDADQSLEVIQDLLHGDPLLAYRLLRMVNSVAFGGTREVNNLRHAVMLLGHGSIRQWLQEQKRVADPDEDLGPVRQTMVLRARLTEYLMDTGPENDLRAEIYTTGLFAEIDSLLRQPMAEALEPLPLSGRMLDALLRQTGPYYPFLQLARLMENPAAVGDIPTLCREHEFRLDDVNRSLIRMLNHVVALPR